jgi:hypothetical protein
LSTKHWIRVGFMPAVLRIARRQAQHRLAEENPLIDELTGRLLEGFVPVFHNVDSPA